MAELAIGIVGLAGLAALFKTASESWELIQTARDFHRDREVLATQLYLEKVRLLDWGRLVALHRSGAGSTWLANNQRAAIAVNRNLSAIFQIWSDAEKLFDNYGLKECAQSTTQVTLVAPVGPVDRLQTNFEAGEAAGLSRPGFALRTKWAIHDKSKVTRLIKELKVLIDGLHDVTPGIIASTNTAMNQKILSVEGDMEVLGLIQEATQSLHPTWSDTASQIMERSTVAGSRRGTIVPHSFHPRPISWGGDGRLLTQPLTSYYLPATPMISVHKPSSPSAAAMMLYQHPEQMVSKVSTVQTWINDIPSERSETASIFSSPASDSTLHTIDTSFSSVSPQASLLAPGSLSNKLGISRVRSMFNLSSQPRQQEPIITQTNNSTLRLGLFRAVQDNRSAHIADYKAQGADVYGLDSNKLSVLHYAIQGYQVKQLRAFAYPGCATRAEDEGRGVSLLHHLLRVRRDRSQGSAPSTPGRSLNARESKALEDETQEILEILLPARPSVSALDVGGRTVIERAIDECGIGFIRTLVNRKHVSEVESKGVSLLHYLLRSQAENRLEIFRILLANGANVEARDNTGATPLIAAAKSGFCNGKGVELLVTEGAELEAQDGSGQTALVYAALHRHVHPGPYDALLRYRATIEPETSLQRYQPLAHDQTPRSSQRMPPVLTGKSRSVATVKFILQNPSRSG